MQAKIYGIPGERVRTAGTLKVLMPLLTALFILGIVVGLGAAMVPFVKPTAAVFSGLLLLAAAIFIWTAHLCPDRVNAFFKGARGEERTAFALEALPEGFYVFNGLPRSQGLGWIRGDFDHVVVGKTGVFVVETKYWDGEVTCDHGRILVNGRPPTREPLAQVLKERDEMEAALAEQQEAAVKVQAVLCFAGRGFQGMRANVNGVEVCHVRDVVDVIRLSGEEALTQDETTLVADRLVRML